MESQEIAISKHTFFEYFEMSSRYEYHELYFSLEKYLHSVPFLTHILNDLICIDTFSSSSDLQNSSSGKSGKENERNNENEKENEKKEEMIAKHLEESIQSGLLRKMKYSRLYRILSSPSLFIENHHLLYDFILSLFDDFQKYNEKGKENEKSILQSFVTFLNYEEMNDEEILKLISHPLFCECYQPKHSTTMIYKLLKQQQSNEILLSTHETRFQELEQKYEEQLSKFETINKQTSHQIINEIEKQIHQQEQEIKEKLSNFEKLFLKHQTEIQNEIETKINSKFSENSKQMKNDYFDSLRQEINSIKLKLNLKYSECQYKNEPFEGIISELTKQTGRNVYESGLVDITGNRNEYYGSFSSLVNYSDERITYLSKDEKNSYLCFDFKNHQISLSHYSIKISSGRYHLRSWKIEGSNDGYYWKELDSHSNDQTLYLECQIHTFEIKHRNQQNSRYRFIRLTQTGLSSYGNNQFALTHIEFFGELY
ncbi:hypothetical protein TRFO_01916 [Tritrichomonas foetus]|uniref:F5/8 type C domain-containing protein n=1 Tax=Tritrichomonas foetus TaxID=1144522 RepID=A0A1J4JNJ7_9EUKA|nr:hypothetical protein TRFO_01916 [Tritrichomonas foetus]|eukprot:OHS98836.1 hypothetical protein TRFO_01916 [Tritrichomonas foetus]